MMMKPFSLYFLTISLLEFYVKFAGKQRCFVLLNLSELNCQTPSNLTRNMYYILYIMLNLSIYLPSIFLHSWNMTQCLISQILSHQKNYGKCEPKSYVHLWPLFGHFLVSMGQFYDLYM